MFPNSDFSAADQHSDGADDDGFAEGVSINHEIHDLADSNGPLSDKRPRDKAVRFADAQGRGRPSLNRLASSPSPAMEPHSFENPQVLAYEARLKKEKSQQGSPALRRGLSALSHVLDEEEEDEGEH